MKIRNLTPHEVTLHADVGSGTVTIAPEGNYPRRSLVRTILGHIVIDDVALPVVRTTIGDVEGLPEAKPGVLLLVSALIAEGCPERDDLISPGALIRDDAGKVIGAVGICAGAGLAALRQDVEVRQYDAI